MKKDYLNKIKETAMPKSGLPSITVKGVGKWLESRGYNVVVKAKPKGTSGIKGRNAQYCAAPPKITGTFMSLVATKDKIRIERYSDMDTLKDLAKTVLIKELNMSKIDILLSGRL